jgi:hypothetical protein
MRRRLAAAAALGLALLAGTYFSSECGKKGGHPRYRLVAEPRLTFTPAEPRSSECPHAASTRAGRVAVTPHALAGLTAVASIENGPRAAQPPRFIDVPEGSERLVLERPSASDGEAFPTRMKGGGFDIRTASGVLGCGAVRGGAGHYVLAKPLRYYESEPHDWPPPCSASPDLDNQGYLDSDGDVLAMAVRGGEFQSVYASPGENRWPTPSSSQVFKAGTGVALELPFNPEQEKQGWGYHVYEPGVGAIDGAGITALALPSGRFVVLRATADPDAEGWEQQPTLAVDARIDASATDLSIVAPFALVVYGGGDAGRLAARRSALASSTHIDARRADGSLAWRAALSFLATQPPIDGNGLIYVVGTGVTALTMDGTPAWSLPSKGTVRAQAFADGTLAVVQGAELRILGRDGVTQKSMRAAEELTSYPAIASDGAIWVASAKTLYVAR